VKPDGLNHNRIGKSGRNSLKKDMAKKGCFAADDDDDDDAIILHTPSAQCCLLILNGKFNVYISH
jgi:hypothetical protein